MPPSTPPLGEAKEAPAGTASPAPPPLLAPPAREVKSPAFAPPEASASPQQAGDLVGYLDQATVMVMSVKPGDGQVGLGSGFFVSDSHVVTNRHVVEGGDPNRVIIARAGTAAPLRGRVVATSASSDIGADDFAVVEVAPDRSRRPLSLTSQVARRTDVVAAGYPAFVMATDAAFQRLLEGRGERVPDAVITQGSVMAVQEGTSGGPALVVHSATIAKGNSGGPLVDLCGRLVGVNTFGRHEEETALRLNFSLQSGALARFLAARGIPARSDDSPCRPQVQAEAPPAAAPDSPVPPSGSEPPASMPPQETPRGAAASPPALRPPGQ
jgi:S1-C subfamily serine protease